MSAANALPEPTAVCILAEPDATPATAANAEGPRWLRLAPYGEHPHSLGLQILDREAAESLVARHQGWRARIRSWITGQVGRPVHLGHPDEAAFANAPGHEDPTTYADAEDLEARADGLYALIRPRPEWDRLAALGKKLYLSARWTIAQAGPGRVKPHTLLSIGLWPRPNIPGAAAANAEVGRVKSEERNFSTQNPSTMNEHLLHLLTALGIAEERLRPASPESTAANADETAPPQPDLAALTAEAQAALTALRQTAANATAAAEAQATAEAALSAANAALATAQADLSKLAARVGGTEIEAALSGGRLLPAQRADWESKFLTAANAAAVETLATELSALPPALKTSPATESAPLVEMTAANARAEFLAAVDAHKANGTDHHTAWERAKKANPDIHAKAYGK